MPPSPRPSIPPLDSHEKNADFFPLDGIACVGKASRPIVPNMNWHSEVRVENHGAFGEVGTQCRNHWALHRPPKKGKAIPDVENWKIWFLCQCIRGWLYINGCKLTHHFTGLQLVSSTVVGGYELCSSMWAPYWMVGKKLRWSTNNILEKYISSSLGGLLFLISSPASGL